MPCSMVMAFSVSEKHSVPIFRVEFCHDDGDSKLVRNLYKDYIVQVNVQDNSFSFVKLYEIKERDKNVNKSIQTQ
jgi:hypothetical protein